MDILQIVYAFPSSWTLEIFLVWAIMKKKKKSCYEHSLWWCIFPLPLNKIAWPYGKCKFEKKKKEKENCFLKCCTIMHSLKHFSCLASFSTYDIVNIFNFSHSTACEVVFHRGINLHFLNDKRCYFSCAHLPFIYHLCFSCSWFTILVSSVQYNDSIFFIDYTPSKATK